MINIKNDEDFEINHEAIHFLSKEIIDKIPVIALSPLEQNIINSYRKQSEDVKNVIHKILDV